MPEFMYHPSGTRDLNPRSQGRQLSGPTRSHVLDRCTAIYDRMRCGWLTSWPCLSRHCTLDHGTVLSYIVPPPLCLGMHLGSWPDFQNTRLFTSVLPHPCGVCRCWSFRTKFYCPIPGCCCFAPHQWRLGFYLRDQSGESTHFSIVPRHDLRRRGLHFHAVTK
ncbi:hypothetical protein BR93DRAFT_237974 [Coniochaeta sp. PMI_546]|nr:hypothetical protein BR93DRAFT_237974 [Coniochaeta sp. PMI_546]